MALTYTSAIVWNAEIADDALWARLYQHFTIPELVELGFFVALTLGQQRWIKTLGIAHGEVLGDTPEGLARGAMRPAAAAPGGARGEDAAAPGRGWPGGAAQP
ncbi:MAG: hypothetical protein QN183_11860 [Armatimonadota bacterium]|nr:hypothetical protein [Armatimonadota bacterium]MDR7485067.1 hypothetical protein [Armatimonadota bacterium]MDR7537044.1 hypothetical protein [Armatimonadota bacterium]